MIETAHKPALSGLASDEKDGSSDEEPGPSCLSVLVECNQWLALEGLDPAIRRAYVACVHKLAAIASRDVCLVLSDDETIAELNGRFRSERKPTNVLSFPVSSLPDAHMTAQEPAPLGDIILACETVIREAAEAGKSPLDHVAHLIVHGVLHLAGFDHQTDRDAEYMEALECEILSSIGIPDPYLNHLEEQPSTGP